MLPSESNRNTQVTNQQISGKNKSAGVLFLGILAILCQSVYGNETAEHKLSQNFHDVVLKDVTVDSLIDVQRELPKLTKAEKAEKRAKRREEKKKLRLERIAKREERKKKKKEGNGEEITIDDFSTQIPSMMPSTTPTLSLAPSKQPSFVPTSAPVVSPSASPSTSSQPSSSPSLAPTRLPSKAPSFSPSTLPSAEPSKSPTQSPTQYPTNLPSSSPTSSPTARPSSAPSGKPSASSLPSFSPSVSPSMVPTATTYCNGLTREERNDEVQSQLSTYFPTGLHEKAENFILYEDERILCSNDTTLEQRYTLAALYFDTDGANWIKGSKGGKRWLSWKSECEWFGLTCNDFGYIRTMHLGNNNLNGTISKEIESLDSLRELWLYENSLSGSFPQLPPYLWDARLYKNNLNGTLPEIWPKKLNRLSINHNKLSGSIDVLANILYIQVLELHRNLFSGTVSIHFGSLADMTLLTLHKNDLTGDIPDDVCLLRDGVLPDNKLMTLTADCKDTSGPKVTCDSEFTFGVKCCTACH